MRYLEDGTVLPDPSIDEQYHLIVEHYHAMMAHYGEVAGVPIARKHLGWYTRGLHGSAEFRNQVNQIGSAQAVLDALARFYEPFLIREAA
jgi:tRNA-dihydrouridine synthase B